MTQSAAIEGSTVLSVVRRSLVTSWLYEHLRTRVAQFDTVPSDIEAWLASSGLVSALAPRIRSLGGLERSSSTHAVAKKLSRWARASFLYRWLTAEPEPEVIVIDLRDTLSVGPVIALLDAVFRATVPASHHSTVRELGSRMLAYFQQAPIRVTSLLVIAATLTALLLGVIRDTLTASGTAIAAGLLFLALLGLGSTRSWNELVESRPVQLLIAVFEPPEPPESDR